MSEEKEYIVTLHNKKDAEQFYEEMETNKSTEHIPSKNFYCDKKLMFFFHLFCLY